MPYPLPIQKIIAHFSKLPSVGPKTAERYVFALLKYTDEELQAFAQAIAELKEKTTVCAKCHAISAASTCAICADSGRDHSTLCVVAGTRDLNSIESAKEFKGIYHVLGGTIDVINGIKPENLKIKELLQRIKENRIKEIILALNPNMQGETTSLYLNKLLKPSKIKITRIARGLPMGSDLEYADEMTLANALKFRNEI